MKLFKCILVFISLLNTNFIAPRTSGQAAVRPAAPAQVIPQPVIPAQPIQVQPISQQKISSYKDLVDFIKNSPNAWDNQNKLLKNDFVTTIVQKGRAANLDAFQIEALLQTARDLHGVFSGDANRDIKTLQSIDNQIAVALRQP